MSQNPYDSPAHSELNGRSRHSLRPYAIATILVVALWLLIVTVLLWFRVLTVADGNVSIEYTYHPSPSAPLGDPTISTHLFYVSTIAALALLGFAVALSVALSLAAANGIVKFRRRKADA